LIAKIGIVEEEADVSTFWLDTIPDTKNATVSEVETLLKEARELTAIFATASETARQNISNYHKKNFLISQSKISTLHVR